MKPLDDVEKSIEVISRMVASLEAQASDKGAMSELSMRQMMHMDAVERLENPTFSELADELGVTKPSVTTMIQKLIQMGFVEKRQSLIDKRVHHVCLTKKGEGLSKAHKQVHVSIARQLLSSLNKTEAAHLAKLLRKVANR